MILNQRHFYNKKDLIVVDIINNQSKFECTAASVVIYNDGTVHIIQKDQKITVENIGTPEVSLHLNKQINKPILGTGSFYQI